MKDNLATHNAEDVFETGLTLNQVHSKSASSAGDSAHERHPMLTLLDGGQNPGSILRAAREKAGLSLADMSSMTKINERQLEIIESGDLARMPQETFAKAFIKSYCKALKMEPVPLINAFGYSETTPLPRVASAPLPSPAVDGTENHAHASVKSGQGKAQPSSKKWGIALLLAGLFLLLGVLLMRYVGLGQTNTMWPASTSGNANGFAVGGNAESGSAMVNSGADNANNEPNTSGNWDVQGQVPPELQAPSQPVPQAAGNAPIAGVEPNAIGMSGQAGGMFPDLQNPANAGSGNAANGTQTSGGQNPESARANQGVANAAGTSNLKFDFSEPSWVTVKDATGKVLMSQLNTAGSQIVLNGQAPFQMIVGNANGVRLLHNGAPVNVSGAVKGEVARITVQ